MENTYEAPSLEEVGSIKDLTLMQDLALNFDGHLFHGPSSNQGSR